MIEIKNITSGPVQLVIRSKNSYSSMVPRKHSAAFTCLNIPGFQTILLEDERVIDTYLKQSEKKGLLKSKVLTNIKKAIGEE